jgi:hypothetical protein
VDLGHAKAFEKFNQVSGSNQVFSKKLIKSAGSNEVLAGFDQVPSRHHPGVRF